MKNGYKKLISGGFTLIELVVVMAVLTILAGIAVPSLSGYYRHGQETERAAQEELVQKGLRQYYAYEGEYPQLTGDPDGTAPLSDAQKADLQALLKNVTAISIDTEYQYIYNESTGDCALALS